MEELVLIQQKTSQIKYILLRFKYNYYNIYNVN